MAKKAGMYALAGLLITGYLLILILGRGYSGESEAYRIFFTDQKLNVFISEADWREVFACGRTESLRAGEDNRNAGKGWSYTAEENGRRMTAEKADVYFWAEEDGAYRVEIALAEEAGGAVAVAVNGRVVGEIDSDGKVAIPEGLVSKGINEIEIRARKGLLVGSIGLFEE